MSACVHRWSMTGIRTGYLVVEGCHHCGGRCSFFSAEPTPPVDEYRQGEHFWGYLGSYQAVRFDLMCDLCAMRVDLGDVMGLMLSTCEDPGCEVGRLVRSAGRSSSVYVALCADTTHVSKTCVSEVGILALNQYFNQGIRAPGKRIIVVPCRMCSRVDNCQGIVIADAGLTDFY
jgi:hypothetical protein